MSPTLLLLALLVPGPTTAPTPSTGSEWCRFRGPDGRGVVGDDVPLPARLDPETNLLWRTALPSGHSSPCLWQDRIFVTGAEGTRLETLALDRVTGEVLWRRAVEARELERLHEINSSAASTATTDGETVVVHFGALGLVAYDLEGTERWRRELEPAPNTFGTAASPVIAEGMLLFLRDTNAVSFLEAIDPASGETIWRRERPGFGSGWSTPVLWEREDALEVLVLGVGWLTAYDLADGSERWAVPGLTDEPIVTPVTGEGLVYVSSYNMRTNTEVLGLPTFEALLAEHDHDGSGDLSPEEAQENVSVLSRADADGEGDHPLSMFFRFLDEDRSETVTAKEFEKLVAWMEGWAHLNGIVALRPPTEDGHGTIAWQHERGVPECPSPLLYRGRLLAVKNGGMATCLDATTGALLFEGRTGARGPIYASPVAGDGKVYTATARGEITVLAAGDALAILSSTELGERVMATPALSRGGVYVRSDGHLWAFADRLPR